MDGVLAAFCAGSCGRELAVPRTCVLIHIVYFSLVALSYRDADLSFVYPIMRGSAPAFSALLVAFLVHESPSPVGWIGVLLVSAGILLLAGDSWRSGSFKGAPTAVALGNAGVIMIYTFVDGVGVRLSGHPASYTSWLFLLTALPLLLLGICIGEPVEPPNICGSTGGKAWWGAHVPSVLTGF